MNSEPLPEEPVTEEQVVIPSEKPVDQTTSDPVVADVAEAPETVPAQAAVQRRSHKKLLLTCLIVLVVAALVAAAFLVGRSQSTKASSVAPAANSKVKKPVPSVATTSGFIDNYLAAPQLLSPQPNFFSDPSDFNFECDGTANAPKVCATYSKIGTTKDGKDIIVVDNGVHGDGSSEYLALQTSPNHYSILWNATGTNTNNSSDYIAAVQKKLAPNVTIDTTTRLSDLTFDQNLTFKGTALTTKDGSGYNAGASAMPRGLASLRGSYYPDSNPATITKLGSFGPQSVYQATVQEGANYKVEELYLTINQVYSKSYYLDSSLDTTNNAPGIKWSSGDYNSDNFTYRAPGCGSFSGYQVAKGINEADLTKAGTGPNNETIYALPTNSPLFQEVYNDYGTGDYLSDASLKNLTADQFQAKHGVFLAKDGFGELVIYENSKYITGGGCGKPVVYLYPTLPTAVNVAVGADVKKSVPTYPVGGWQHVLASPSGQLTYQGQGYPNLYWEGTGKGEYPIVDSGVVVTAKDAPAVIRSQLAAQGLNATETKDFLEYWQPRLPHTPYVRLTWFDTAQMNQLAPLTINPRPMTTIRVFLDFQGLNHRINLPAQQLSATPRLGFTVVEWGGLERSN